MTDRPQFGGAFDQHGPAGVNPFARDQPRDADPPLLAPDGRAAIGEPSPRVGRFSARGGLNRLVACAGSAGPTHRCLPTSVSTRGSGSALWTSPPVPFQGGDAPSGPGSCALRRAPAEPGLGPCGLRSLSRAPRRPRAVLAGRVGARSPRGRVSARTGCATARMGSGATARRRGRQGPITGPCRPARRSRGAAGRRPRRAPRGTPCP